MIKRSIKVLCYYVPTVLKAGVIRMVPPLYRWVSIKPRAATLNITDKCCLRCIACDQWRNVTPGELTTEQWQSVVGQLAQMGVTDVTLSGGEPLMRPDIADIVAAIVHKGLTVTMITNGYLLDGEKIAMLLKSGVRHIGISIDAVGDAFDTIRGRSGAFERVVNNCEILAASVKHQRARAYIYFTLMRQTLSEYMNVFLLAQRFGFPFVVNLFDYTPYFFAGHQQDKDDFWLTEQYHNEVRQFQQFLLHKKAAQPHLMYHSFTEIEYMKAYFTDPLQQNIPCAIALERINIDARGNVYGGCWSGRPFGNVTEETLSAIITSQTYKDAHKRMFFKQCPGCSCGYAANLRFNLGSIIKELKYTCIPITRKAILQ